MPRPEESPLFTLEEVTILRDHTRNLMDRVLFDIVLDTAWPLSRIVRLERGDIELRDELDRISGYTDETGKKLEPVTLYRSGSDLRVLKTLYRPVTHDALFFDNKGDRLSEVNAQKMFRQLGIDSKLGGAVFRRLRRTAVERRKELRVSARCPRCNSSVNRDDLECKRCGMLLDEKMANDLLECRMIEKKKIDMFDYTEAVTNKYGEWISFISGLVDAVQTHMAALPYPEDIEKMAEVINSFGDLHQREGFSEEQREQSWTGVMLAVAKIAQAAPAHQYFTQTIIEVFTSPNEPQFQKLLRAFSDGMLWIMRHYEVNDPVRPFLQ